jgi:D-glycero-D-manno-heptose 1,7-bisphosphate phosphatase
MNSLRPAVFVDRDGVLNYNRREHIKSPDEFAPIPGAGAAVAALKQAGWVVVIVSNQSGIGRGLFGQEALEQITAKMVAGLEAAGGRVDGIYYCPHTPEAECGCRKPAPGLVRRAAMEHGLDLRRSYFIGDKAADIACGQAVGTRTLLVETGLPEERPDPAVARPDHVARDMSAAVEWILQQQCRQP